jgi:hypothetical protein
MTENKTYNLPQHLVEEWMKGGHQLYVVWLIDLLMMANELGEVDTSVSDLSRRWKVHRNSVQKFLDVLTAQSVSVYRYVYRYVYRLTFSNIDSYKGCVADKYTDTCTDKEKEKNKEKEISPCTPSKEKENKKEKETIPVNAHTRTRARKVFQPPSVDDVYGYCFERGYTISAEHFVDFYTSNGWMVGKNKMKDWRAAVRTWAVKQKQYTHGNNHTSTTAEQRLRGAAELCHKYLHTKSDATS